MGMLAVCPHPPCVDWVDLCLTCHPLGSAVLLAGTELWDPVLPPRCLFPGPLGFVGLIRREIHCEI